MLAVYLRDYLSKIQETEAWRLFRDPPKITKLILTRETFTS